MNEIFFTSGPTDAEDMKEFYAVNMRKRISAIVFGVLFAVAFTVCVIIGAKKFYYGNEVMGRILFAVALFFSVLFIVEKLILRAEFIKLNVKRGGKSLKKIDIDGLHSESDVVKCDMKYDGISDFSESEGLFMFYPDKGSAFCVPKRNLCAMIPTSAGQLSIDVLDLFRNYVFAATGKRFRKRKKAKVFLIEAVAAVIAVMLLIYSLFAGNILLGTTTRVTTSGYSISIPVNLTVSTPQTGGNLHRLNDKIEIYNYLDEISGVVNYFGYVPTCEEYMNAVFTNQDSAKFVTKYSLENNTYCIFCEYNNDDCFYGRAVTAGNDGFWTTVFIGFADERTNTEQYFVKYAGSIQVN